MITTKQKAIINEMFHSIDRVTEGGGYFDSYVNDISKGEKQYRKYSPPNTKNSLNIQEAVRYFACLYVLQGKGKRPDVKFAHITKIEVFVGYAIYHQYKNSLKTKIKAKQIKEFMELDYLEMKGVK